MLIDIITALWAANKNSGMTDVENKDQVNIGILSKVNKIYILYKKTI